MDVSVISKKSNLTVSAYRQLKNGTVKMAKLLNFTETRPEKKGKYWTVYTAETAVPGSYPVSSTMMRCRIIVKYCNRQGHKKCTPSVIFTFLCAFGCSWKSPYFDYLYYIIILYNS